MFCAGDLQGGGADACQGDSGGPAVGMVHGKATLIGISYASVLCVHRRMWLPGTRLEKKSPTKSPNCLFSWFFLILCLKKITLVFYTCMLKNRGCVTGVTISGTSTT